MIAANDNSRGAAGSAVAPRPDVSSDGAPSRLARACRWYFDLDDTFHTPFIVALMAGMWLLIEAERWLR